MNITIKKLFNKEGQEIGAILRTIHNRPVDTQQKHFMESQLIQYGFDNLYPEEGLSIFRDLYVDTPSVALIKNIEGLSEIQVSIG